VKLLNIFAINHWKNSKKVTGNLGKDVGNYCCNCQLFSASTSSTVTQIQL